MPRKTIVTTIAVGVHDPERDTPEVRDFDGRLIQPGTRGLAHKAPGDLVTLDAAEADSLIARFGGEVVEEIPDEPAKAKTPAK